MSATRFVQGVMVALFVVLPLWDVWLALDGVPDNTISKVWRTWCARWWVLPWALAGLWGHFHGPPIPGMPGWVALLLIPCALGLFALCAFRVVRMDEWWVWWMWGALGLCMGALMWPIET